MKKISQGKFELFTTKEDAIDKLMQMQGICREEISEERPIQFYCYKKGEIIISNPATKHEERWNSTNLYAEVVTEDGKTYVTYYTAFSKSKNIYKKLSLATSILIIALLTIFAIIHMYETVYIITLLMLLAGSLARMFETTKEKKNSTKDSEILIKELEKRVEAVNMWDK